MSKKIGLQTIEFENRISILSTASIAGHREGMGPLAKYYDKILEDAQWGEDTWEKTESKMQKTVISRAVEKAEVDLCNIDFLFAGDLLNQCTSSTFAFRDYGVPFLGVYGACSTMAETIGLASTMLDSGAANLCGAVTSSHFCTAERQYRFPLEYGGQRTPTAQWTVTGAGGVILGRDKPAPCVTHFTVGKIVDAGVSDANNMGAAMAPAAAETILTHFEDTGRTPDFYDLILTGDLGKIGKSILTDLLEQKGYDMRGNYNDCGCMVFDINDSDIHGGGSGCGCGAITLCGYIWDMFRAGEIKNLLFVGTGALLSPTSSMQGESIPSVAHAVAISAQ